jgi:hypothetical protein
MGKLDIHVISCKISNVEPFMQRSSFYSVGKQVVVRASPVLQHAVTTSDSMIGLGASALVDVLMESGSRPRLRGNITGKLRMMMNGMPKQPVHIQDVFERPCSPPDRTTDAT